MSEKPKTVDEVRKERYRKQVMEVKALGELALSEIDEALAGNVIPPEVYAKLNAPDDQP